MKYAAFAALVATAAAQTCDTDPLAVVGYAAAECKTDLAADKKTLVDTKVTALNALIKKHATCA